MKQPSKNSVAANAIWVFTALLTKGGTFACDRKFAMKAFKLAWDMQNAKAKRTPTTRSRTE